MSITIDKRPSGKYRAQVRISGYPPQSKSFPRRAQAAAWADSLHRDLLDQQVDPTALSKRRTLLHGIDLYLEEEVPRKKSAATITNRLRTWRKRINLAEMVRGATETELHKIALEIGEQLQKQLNLDRRPKPNEIPRALLGLELGLRFGI